MEKQTLEKVFEYASSPVHGTLSRKLRKGVKIQVNDGNVFEGATLFLGDEFVRVTVKVGEETRNTYYAWDKICCVTTIGKVED
ncbi:hypothetical protein [Solidesulfovibrio sp.]|uniref:hypothetical protein n=1 Tax=Solidesulfovibrio sp. TaxID=2910990 RepID=UPI00262442BF|nr:hypothetical protein [Solidesulfovibrio sp.]